LKHTPKSVFGPKKLEQIYTYLTVNRKIALISKSGDGGGHLTGIRRQYKEEVPGKCFYWHLSN